MKTYTEKLGQRGEIRIPEDYLRELGLYPGEELELQMTGEGLLLKPLTARASKTGPKVVDKLYGALKLDPQIAAEVGSKSYPYNPEDV